VAYKAEENHFPFFNAYLSCVKGVQEFIFQSNWTVFYALSPFHGGNTRSLLCSLGRRKA